MTFMNKYIENRPVRKANMNGIIKLTFKVRWFILSKVAPNIAGTDNKNENLSAFPLGIPKKKAVDVVEPERDIPGSIASAWLRPMTKVFFRVRGVFLFCV